MMKIQQLQSYSKVLSSVSRRVPRVELPKVVTPAIEGDLLVHYHHDEDGKFGINVINEDGERWRWL